jgi:hypothetical protein
MCRRRKYGLPQHQMVILDVLRRWGGGDARNGWDLRSEQATRMSVVARASPCLDGARQRAMLWSANTEGVGKVFLGGKSISMSDRRSALASEACAKATNP